MKDGFTARYHIQSIFSEGGKPGLLAYGVTLFLVQGTNLLGILGCF